MYKLRINHMQVISIKEMKQGLVYPETIKKEDPTSYQKISSSGEKYLAFVVAVRDYLNFHLDIYWPSEVAEKYKNALQYQYTFISEELEGEQTRTSFSCHLRGVEVDTSSAGNMKEAYILVTKHIYDTGGWVLVSADDIDVYRRVLIEMFDVVTKKSLNQELLDFISLRTGEPIAREYNKVTKNKVPFYSTTKDYLIIYESPTL